MCVQSLYIKMSAQETGRLSTSTLCPGKDTKWRSALKQHLKTVEDKRMTAAADKRSRRKEDSSCSIRHEITLHDTHINYVLSATKTATRGHIDLFSHKRRCYATQQEINKIKNKTKTLGCLIHAISDRRRPLDTCV